MRLHSPGQGKPILRVSLRSSDAAGRAKGRGTVPLAGTRGRISFDPSAPPSARVVVIEFGVGHIIGQSPLDTESLTRCPFGNTHDAKCISILKEYSWLRTRFLGSVIDSR